MYFSDEIDTPGIKSTPSKDATDSLKVTPKPSLERQMSLKPSIIIRKDQVSYKNLSDFLFKKETTINLNKLPTSQRLTSVHKFRMVHDLMKRKPLHQVVMRAKQLMEEDTLEKVELKAEMYMKDIGSPGSDPNSPRRLAKSRSRRKTKILRTGSRTQVTLEKSVDKNSLEARIREISKHNRLVRQFVKVVTDKENLFHLEFTQEYLSYLIVAFFEQFNLNKIPHSVLVRATEEGDYFKFE